MYDDDYRLSKQSRDYVKEIGSLSEKEIEKIERVCGALERQFSAEASKEAHQKMRILFQRAAKEHLPFIIYFIYMSVVGVAAFWNINKVTEWFLIAYLVALVLIMLVPLIALLRVGYKIAEEKSE